MIAKGYSDTYLRTVNNQLTAVFNYAVKYYDLKNNPCTKAGNMGKNQAEEMNFWTKEEFTKFLYAVMDKHRSYVGFKTLLWTGLRIGDECVIITQTRKKPVVKGFSRDLTRSYLFKAA